ncbi:MAG: VCBS repeat-containing protein, partial [Saprospiraceae bacterium]|nr:VCBS repeat-containing protein [Saprospiraceae bacterium]
MRPLSIIVAGSLIILLLGQCQPLQNQETASRSLFQLLDSSRTQVGFINSVVDQEDFNILSYRNYYNGGGVAIGDVDNDGLADIYFTANMSSNKLYVNQGEFLFEDHTESGGVGGTKTWSTGVTMVDINADGWLDIYVCNSGDVDGNDRENELFINLQDGTFIEQAGQYGLDDIGYSTHASFFDYDADGDLDCYILNNSIKRPERVALYEKSREERDSLGGDKLYINEEGLFQDVSAQAGIYSSEIGFGLGVSVGDLNSDYWPDIYISNDFFERDYLYLNQGNGTFKEQLEDNMNHISLSSMGLDIGDLDNDGDQEVFTTDMLPSTNYRVKTMTNFESYYLNDVKYQSNYGFQYVQNCLQVNDGSGRFNEEAFVSGVAATDWSWGSLMFDFDLDGMKDIFVCNGIYRDITDHDFRDFISDQQSIMDVVAEKEGANDLDILSYIPSSKVRNAAFLNHGQLRFENESERLGLGQPSFSNGAAYGDLDNDGDLDLVVNNINSPCFIYQNQSVELFDRHYLKIKLKGSSQNRFGVGATIRLRYRGEIQQSEMLPARGYESSVDPSLVFGLDDQTIVDTLEVIWPSRKRAMMYNVSVDTTLTLDIAEAKEHIEVSSADMNPYFRPVEDVIVSGECRHIENQFDDFQHELLLPHTLSNEGPKILRGDVNKDLLQDFILLGAAGDEDKVFLQSTTGQFLRKPQPQLSIDQGSESNCGALFDADNDNDLDLMIGVGGNEYNKGFASFSVRFYRNDGKGNFSKDVMNAPQAGGNLSCIRPGDFDRDGDLDVFLGGRVVPGNYGLIPRSFLIQNEGGAIWTDVTNEVTGNLGMVTDAVWSDLDGDHYRELVVVGEWMPVTIIKNSGGKLVEKREVPDSHGWWNCIEKSDMDGDGDDDFVLGNWGMNSKWTASIERPLTMFVKDFDNNQKSEFVINWFAPEDEQSYPFASKMDLTSQLPQLRKKALKYDEYAKSTYDDLFPQEER